MANSSAAEPVEFSLVAGGPIYQLLLRLGLVRPGLASVRRAVLALTLFAWLPLLLLSLLGGSPSGSVPFLHDLGTHVRLLVALPLLIGADALVQQRLRASINEFPGRGIVVPEDLPRFRAALAAAMRARNSWLLELGLLVFVFTIGHLIWRHRFASSVSTWYLLQAGERSELTLAGYWFAFVSIPLAQFFLLRWYVRFVIWYSLLWRISRLNLRLTPTHPDDMGGLGFVGESVFAFAPVLIAQGALIAGVAASRMFLDGLSLATFKAEILGVVIFSVLLVLLPLMVFTPNLLRARRVGRHEYGDFANRFVQAFERKWVGEPHESATLLASGDVRSFSGVASSYKQVNTMRILPFELKVVTRLALLTLLPILPLALTIVPIETIVDKLIKALL